MDEEHDQFFNAPPTQEKCTMSLEQALTENTAALREVIIALAAHHVPGGAAVTGKAPAEKPAAGKPAASKPAATGGALDYEKDVKPLALMVAQKKTREGLVNILKTFNVAQANLLKPEQYGAFITACNTALAAK